MAKRLYFKDYYYLQGNHVHIHGVGGLKLPSGDTIDRPETMESVIRYNAERNEYELGTNNSLLILHDRKDGTGTFYSTLGGELRGDLVIKDHRILNNPGTTINPAYSFYNDTDTGLNSPTSDTIDIVVGGRINSTPAINISRTGSGDNDQTVVINGELIVKGTQTVINSSDLYVEDQIITLNKNGASASQSGIEIEGDGEIRSKFVFDFSTDKWSSAGKSISDVPEPVVDYDVTNKKYVDEELDATETSIRTDMAIADQELDDKITAERNRAITRENNIEQALFDETDRAINRENAIAQDLANEVVRATTREDELDNLKEDKAQKSQAGGYASLDDTRRVPKDELPTDVLYANVAQASEIVLDDTVPGVNGNDAQAGINDLGIRVKSIEDGNLNEEAVRNITGTMVSGNVERGISVTFDQDNEKFDFDVDDFTLTVDGDMAGSSLITDLSDTTITITLKSEPVQDIVGPMFEGNDVKGITTYYNDATNKIDLDVDDFDITLGGDVTGTATVTNLGDVFINTTMSTATTQSVVADMVTGNNEKGLVSTYNDVTKKIDFDVNDFNITLSGPVSGVGSVVDLGNVIINTSIDGETIQDIVGPMFSGNEAKGIVTSYNDDTNKIDLDVDDFEITLTGGVTGSGTVTDLGDVTINTELAVDTIRDIIGDMVSGNTELGIAVTYDSVNSKLDFDTNDFDVVLDGDTTGSATVTDLSDITINTVLSETLSGDYEFTGSIDVNKLSFNQPSSNSNPFEIYRVNAEDDESELRVRIGDNDNGDDLITFGTSTNSNAEWREAMHIKNNGNVGITGNLVVDGTITGQIMNDISWSQVIDRPDPTITVDGDMTGSVTLAGVSDGTLTLDIDPEYNLILVPNGSEYPASTDIRTGLNPITAAQSADNPNGSGYTGISVLESASSSGTTGFQMMVGWNNGTDSPQARPVIRTKDSASTDYTPWRELAWFDEVERSTFEYKLERTIASNEMFDITKEDIFGAVDLVSKGIDFRDLKVDVKVLDNDASSNTNNMWISASAVSTYGVDSTNEIVRVINEYTSTLQFYIRISL